MFPEDDSIKYRKPSTMSIKAHPGSRFRVWLPLLDDFRNFFLSQKDLSYLENVPLMDEVLA